MPNVPFIQAVQSRAARISVSASATRGNGAGVVAAGRSFLARLPLTAFATSRPNVFHRRLDTATGEMSVSLPAGARSWGTPFWMNESLLLNSFACTGGYPDDG